MNVTDLLKKNGLKKSAQRVALVNILLKHRRPLTEEDMKSELGEVYDRVTFYRTMQMLVSVGIVHRIVVDNTTVEYALSTEEDEHAHVHFYCKVCHAVTCMKEVPVYHYQLPDGYRQEECEVVIKGVCPTCAAQGKPAGDDRQGTGQG